MLLISFSSNAGKIFEIGDYFGISLANSSGALFYSNVKYIFTNNSLHHTDEAIYCQGNDETLSISYPYQESVSSNGNIVINGTLTMQTSESEQRKLNIYFGKGVIHDSSLSLNFSCHIARMNLCVIFTVSLLFVF